MYTKSPSSRIGVYPFGDAGRVEPRGEDLPVVLLRRSADRHGDQPAFHHAGETLSFAGLNDASDRLAAYLVGVPGLSPGARVALMCPNVLAFPVALFGVLKARLVLVNVNPFYTADELRHQLADSEAAVLIAADTARAAVIDGVQQTGVRLLIGIGAGPGLDGSAGSTLVATLPAGIDGVDFAATLTAPAADLCAAEPDELALLQYTGGTTGRPKGAMLSHGNLAASVLGFSAFLGPADPAHRDIVVSATPLYHILGLCVNCLTFVHRGGMNLLIDNPRDAEGIVTTLEAWRFSVITGVNTLFNSLLAVPAFAQLDFSGLRLAMGGGTPIQESVSRRWHAVTGQYIKEGYGMSETCGLTQTPLQLAEYRSTIGLPYPGLELSLRDQQDQEVAVGAPGEICVKGPSITAGYWRDGARTGFTADGFFMTGDVAVMEPDGYLRIVDRSKDMILVSGFNVYPSEVEAAASGAPGVHECACIGVPDERSGEAVVLFVVPRPGASADIEAIRQHCRERLARYKVPRHLRVVDALPKTAVGKILRRELRDMV